MLQSLSLFYGTFWNGTTTNAEIIAVLKSNRDDAFHYDAKTSRLDLVQEVWEHEIIPFLNMANAPSHVQMVRQAVAGVS